MEYFIKALYRYSSDQTKDACWRHLRKLKCLYLSFDLGNLHSPRESHRLVYSRLYEALESRSSAGVRKLDILTLPMCLHEESLEEVLGEFAQKVNGADCLTCLDSSEEDDSDDDDSDDDSEEEDSDY